MNNFPVKVEKYFPPGDLVRPLSLMEMQTTYWIFKLHVKHMAFVCILIKHYNWHLTRSGATGNGQVFNPVRPAVEGGEYRGRTKPPDGWKLSLGKGLLK